MSEIPKPYVGVSGVVSPHQHALLREIAAPLDSVGRKLAVGVKAVHKTQWLDVENKSGPTWYPVGDDISDAVMTGNERSEIRVAQVYLDVEAARERGVENYESRFISKLLGRTGLWLNAVQFDLLQWHTTDYSELFAQIQQADPDLRIILQCQGPIMDSLSPVEVMKRLDRYRSYISYVLFDASHGTGAKLDTAALRPYVGEAHMRGWLGVGVAGGLDEHAIRSEMSPLLGEFPNLSFDAEGRLHKRYRDDKSLDITVVQDYLLASAEVIRSVQQ